MEQIRVAIDARESGTTTGRYVDKLVEYLHKLKTPYKFVVLTTPKRVEFMKKLAPRFEVIETKHKEFTFAEQLGLWKQLRDLKLDLVHFPMVQQPILYRGKVVTTMQDLTTARFRNTAKNWLVFTVKQQIYRWVNRVVARKSVVVMTPTEFVKDDVARFTHTNSRKFVVTYEAADAIGDKPEVYEAVDGKQFIMYVGRPQPHKNLDRLVEAFHTLRQEYPGLYLVLAGKKDVLYRRMEKEAQKSGINNLIFTDFVTEGQLRWLYEHCVAYVFPSLSEGFGLPGLEAMVHGAPVVSSNATCLPEVYKDAAEYFDPDDTEDMARAIGRVLSDDSLRKQLIKKGEKVSASYSWQRMAEETLAVYETALSDGA
jgi:glycosyltransferase involved in cell wall biosynthesis